MDLELLKERLKEHGREVGLDLVGVASAEPFLKEKARMERREKEGPGKNPFEPQEMEPRIYPEMLLPGVKSIISAAISYLMPEEPFESLPEEGKPLGWFSRYCRTQQDYHYLLKDRLSQLAAWLEEQYPGAHTLVYVDTGPPLDRSIAERAGVGKPGKHTALITNEYGTWVFLGEILTDVPLPADVPIEAACGTCTLCIDACPTGALTEWNLDWNSCLSYVTQMKGMIPEEYRESMDNRVFGCDDCQDVCPWNRRAKPGNHPEFAPGKLGHRPELLQLMSMTKSDFREWIQPTAAGWRGKTTIQRNAIIALGNSGDPAGLETLIKSLSNESQVIRAHAAWALGRLARKTPTVIGPVREALRSHLERETDPTVIQEAETALQSIDKIRTDAQTPAG